MKSFIAIASFALLATAFATPLPENILTYYDNDGNLVTEDLDKPYVSTYSVDIDKLRFFINTRSNRDTPQELKNGDANGLKNSHFNSQKQSIILIHGWQNDFKAESMTILRDAFLDTSDVQVFTFDYKEYNAPYISAYGDAKEIGEKFATFVKFLISHGLNKNNIHIIGHSLGAHISHFLNHALGSSAAPHVTGLDAAGPMFDTLPGTDGRLSSKSADKVDCIHTSETFGMTKSCGSIDLFPHGGSNQPSCSNAAVSDGCDHSASYRYYAETIRNNNKYPAKACKNIEDAKEGSKCSSSNVHMGPTVFSSASSGAFYVPV